MQKLRLGVMGGASIAERLVIPAIQQLNDKFELVAIASRTSENARRFASLFNAEGIVGYDTLVGRNDIDVIYMPLPTGLHEEWVKKCLEAGKHVLVEKSLAMNVASANSMVTIARAKKLVMMENFMFQYHSQHQWVWKLLAEKEIGDVRLVRAQFGFPPLDRKSFRYDKAAGGGSLLDAAGYTVKASQWFLKSKLKVSSATLYVDAETGVDIYGNATLMNETGLVAQVSFGFDNFYQCNYELWGSKGKIHAERAYTPKPHEKPVIVLEKQGVVDRRELDADNHFINLLNELHRAIITGDYAAHLDEILSQSETLSEIDSVATRITI